MLLLASSAVPVLAVEPSTGTAEPTLPGEATLEPEIPGGEDIREASEAAEQKEDEYELWLESPVAAAEREESRDVFTELSAIEATELLPVLFFAQFGELNADPARFLSDANLIQPLGTDERAAAVSEGGDSSLLEADIPVRTEDEEGELRKVDLSLESSADGYETTNALTDVHIPASAAEPVEIGAEGLAIRPEGVETRAAQLLGDENVYYHDVLPDVGYMAAPISGGVELFNFLYSPQSSEELRYELALPEGAELRADGIGGAEVTKGEDLFAHVPFPTAIDAQGSRVPVEMAIEGSTLVLHVPHQEADFAYPILVDPIVENWGTAWYYGTNLEGMNAWKYSTNDPTETYILHNTYCLNSALCSPSGRGLFISTMNRNIPPNTWAQWHYYVPGGTTYIPSIYPSYSAHLNPFWRNNGNCSWNSYSEPYDYDGAFDAAGNWVYLEEDRAQWYGTASIFTKAKGIAFGMSTRGSWVNIPCWRNIMLGGSVIHLDDPENPTLNSVTGVPSGWVSDANSFTITANASDPGLGIYETTLFPKGRPTIVKPVGCTGTAMKPCPSSRTESFGLNDNHFDEGEKTVEISAKDVLGKPTSTYVGMMKVDRTPPEVVLGGQLAVATKETEGDAKDPEKWDELNLPVYNLTIAATDIGPESDANAKKRSGVKSIEIFLDAKTAPEKTWTQTCPGSSCAMTQTYSLKLNELSADVHHTLKVKVKDQVNKERVREIEFEYIPATGMKDDYVMHYFPLPDGLGNEADEEQPNRPELAVNVMNGNLVYREQDIEVEGPAVDLEVERYYNSLLPTSENTEWGDGWTLAQTPDLEPLDTGGTAAADEAELLETSGAIDEGVQLPTEPEGEKFDPALQATLTKKPAGGYELADETGETATSLAFDEGGQTEALLTEGQAKVDYGYEGGELSEITVEDPASGDGSAPSPADQWDPYGTAGSGNGQFNVPVGLAADAKGNVWVADTFNNRIQKFGPNGEYLSQFGTAGSGNGQLSQPYGLVVDSAGNIWVADTANNRIQKFGPSGTYLTQFGTSGTGNGQFALPTRVALDSAGNVWVADSGNNRLQKFGPGGEYLSQLGTEGSGNGQLNYPTGIAFDATGNLWVADKNNNRLQKFSPGGEYLSQLGSLGSGEGQLNGPSALSIDAEGNLWVADSGNHRIEKFSSGGKYLTQFGQNGSGAGQFKSPYGMAFDSTGNIWVADTFNNRIQVRRSPSQWSQFGTGGAGNGNLSIPVGLAADSKGNVWVADTFNNRIQRFGPNGEYLSQFGTAGSGNGQLSLPYGLAVDSAGNVWVADTANHRIQKFGPGGQYLSQFGTKGSGNGQLSSPTRIAIHSKGWLWVADSGNNRIQKFGPSGEYLGQFGSTGSGNGQFAYPAGIALGPEGHLWVADRDNDRIQEFNAAGEYLGQFGKAGSGNGELNTPTALGFDIDGTLWIADSANHRIQAFTTDGEYLARLGTKGSNPGQFKSPYGLAIDPSGSIWIADSNNNRLQRWAATPSPELEEEAQLARSNDPSVEVGITVSDLVGSVEGQEAGSHSYAHVGDDLTAYTGPQGETKYQYDSAGRMTKVTLPNGTYASIAYNVTYGRVSSVTVDPAGSDPAKTTYFEFSDEPRRTTVIPPDAPHVTYDIGADGSVLKWWNTASPPSLDDLSGSLYAGRGTLIAIGTHNLIAQAHSEEGIASIQFIANGNQLIDEMTCEQDPNKAGLECLTVLNEWVTETGALTPGILQLEVITIDRLGKAESERFWVDVPYTPPEPPGALTPPKFMDILRFREEYGLEVIFPVANELELNDRIFDLVGAWHNPNTPAGEVARASMERWGVPLRPVDVAELEYREQYLSENGPLIDQWGTQSASSSYAGYYMDHRAGGKLRIGFTSNAPGNLAMVEGLPQVQAVDRLALFTDPPSYTVVSLETLLDQTGPALSTHTSPAGLVTRVGIQAEQNRIRVYAIDVPRVSAARDQLFGAGAPISVLQDDGQDVANRFRTSGPILAGDHIAGEPFSCATNPSGCRRRCTAGFGAWDRVYSQNTQQYKTTKFTLVTGHCWEQNESIFRPPAVISEKAVPYGQVRRRSYLYTQAQAFTDTEAVRPYSGTMIPSNIYLRPGVSQAVRGTDVAKQGQRVCFSGYATNKKACGKVTGRAEEIYYRERSDAVTWLVPVDVDIEPGDSGAPVWLPNSGKAVGLVAYGGAGLMWYAPLLPPQKSSSGKSFSNKAPGALAAPGMGDLHLETAD